MPVTEAVRLLRVVVDALAHAHQHGVVHRDIKPDNVMLSGRHALVTDFGIAQAVSEATGRQELTTAGVALGAPVYMAPEQAVADPHIDHRVDIYAVGALAYELLAGRPPFTGTTPQMVLSAHVTEAPESITKYRESVPPALAQLVMKCLEKKPADRWQSADDLLTQLEALATPSGGTVPVRGVSSALSKRRLQIAAVAGLLIVVAAGAWAWLRPGGSSTLDPDLVVVAPFDVLGEELELWREGLVDVLSRTLDGAGPLTTSCGPGGGIGKLQPVWTDGLSPPMRGSPGPPLTGPRRNPRVYPRPCGGARWPPVYPGRDARGLSPPMRGSLRPCIAPPRSIAGLSPPMRGSPWVFRHHARPVGHDAREHDGGLGALGQLAALRVRGDPGRRQSC